MNIISSARKGRKNQTKITEVRIVTNKYKYLKEKKKENN